MSKKILVIEHEKFLAELGRVALDAHNEMFEDATEMLNAFRTILCGYEQDVIKFEADEQKARAWGELRRWLEVTIPVAEMHRNGITDTAEIKIYLTDVLVKMDKLLKGEKR